nr:retrovirus-related Pol polyprotein from transposon TNT 1-94 [Tanacetum cinerariifolium]
MDSTKYKGRIGSLLYLMASRPDIMFSICLCARFQEDPKTSHLEVVKRIFRCIKGLESKEMRECCFVVERDAWLRGEFTLSSLDVLQGFSFFFQMGLTLILATFDGLDVGLLGDVIGEDDCDDDG